MVLKKVIPGIHNYCDRWCERCYFTSLCSVYENPDDISQDERDLNNKAFWDKLTKNFQNAMIMLQKVAEAQGINLQDIPQEEQDEIHAKQKQLRELSKRHPLSVLSFDYADQAHTWFKDNKCIAAFEQKINNEIVLGLISEDAAQQQADTVKDSLEIIQWYLHFIGAKLNRAVSGKLEDDGWEEENGFQKDSDGSAKIAIIAIERSTQAWLQLLDFMPEAEDDCLKLLAMLQKMKNLAVKEFPNASAFIRPGFDEENPQVEEIEFPD